MREFEVATTQHAQRQLATNNNNNNNNNANTNLNANNDAPPPDMMMDTDETTSTTKPASSSSGNSSANPGAADDEAMDVETAAVAAAGAKPTAVVPRQPPSDAEIDREMLRSVSRCLNAFWTDECEGQIIVTDAALAFHDQTDTDETTNYEDLVSTVLMEILMQFFDGKLIDLKLPEQMFDTTAAPSPLEPVAASASTPDDATTSAAAAADAPCTSAPRLQPFNLADVGCIKYLMASHDRCNVEQSLYNETRRRRDYGAQLLPLLASIKAQIIDYSLLVLTGTIRLPQAADAATAATTPQQRSPLLDLLYDHQIPSDYLHSLIAEANARAMLSGVFGPVVHSLFVDMRSRIVAAQLNVQPIVVLNELFNVVLPQHGSGGGGASSSSSSTDTAAAAASGSSRPICQLVGKLYNFYPTLVTDMQGLEIAHTSYLGPFLGLSVFVEENPRFMNGELSKRDSIEEVAPDVQQQLENMRCLLHAVFHSLLKNVESRNSVLMYVSAVLRHNDKRTQFHADERTMARDGFMCNLLCVLQKLSVKIKLERVDGMYPFHWEAMINIGKETKLRFAEPEYKQWIETLRECFV